ncbi:hypothetical protein [uncultured Nonlabens sp.]|uniref:hypothetical protein n=1 Tax=uncultured Nonlabens sp. TaxID=859306 RepID=UPI0026360B70|nr:hypothetical protein [uncultured Nonlabens sp.]
MKNITLTIACLFLLGCKSEKEAEVTTTVETSTAIPVENRNTSNSSRTAVSGKMEVYLEDLKTLEDTSKGNPIEVFQELAEEYAAEKIDISKDNFAQALKTASKYKHVYITVKNHTIVKIKDIKNCKPSGSWATCVPYATGYIKKGAMQYREDYANNIIGRPDTQQRVMYLFH